RSPHGGLHGLRHAARVAGLVHVRQHARLRGGAARIDDGSGDPEERGLLRGDRADRARGLLPESDAGPLGGGGRAPSRRGVEVGEAVCLALARVSPERACPQIYKAGMPAILYGVHPDTGQVFVDPRWTRIPRTAAPSTAPTAGAPRAPRSET